MAASQIRYSTCAGVRVKSTTWIARLHVVHAKAKVILTPARQTYSGRQKYREHPYPHLQC